MALNNEFNRSPRVTNTVQNESSVWHRRGEAITRQHELVDEQLKEWREMMKRIRANDDLHAQSGGAR